MNDPILNILITHLNELKESIINYPAQDYPSYRERVGHYQGFKEALDMVAEAISQDDN
jgi:hypothetical protein